MTKFTTVLMTTALVLGTASASFADHHGKKKMKDMAVDEAAKRVEQPVKGAVGETMGDASIDMAKDMAKGDSMKDAAMGTVTDMGKSEMGASDVASGMSTNDAMTAGGVMLKGGSVQDAGVAVAKDRMKTKAKGMATDMVMEKMSNDDGSMIDGRVKSASDTDMMKTTTMTAPSPVMADPVMTKPAAAPVTTMAPVNCPAGTTAQPDGSCMITGDYDY